MCGISAVVLKQNNKAAKKAVNILMHQEHRGTSSTGIAYTRNNMLVVHKDTASPTRYSQKYQKYLENLNDDTVIAHNRMPSIGAVTVENAHPFVSCDSRLALVHNGTESVDSLKSFLIGLGHTFTSTTDSEVLLHCIEELSNRKGMKEGMKELKEVLNGSSVLVMTNTGDIYGYGAAIYIISDETGYYIASETKSFMGLFRGQRKMVYKPRGTFAIINKKLVFFDDYSKERKTITTEQTYTLDRRTDYSYKEEDPEDLADDGWVFRDGGWKWIGKGSPKSNEGHEEDEQIGWRGGKNG